ncbi:MAG: hypothetical protein KF838_12625 [Phycisphaeraceae bacterium]|nr:MAG: hypothetical protein KF838_12625 [Phycisphaeraceae bacterium]
MTDSQSIRDAYWTDTLWKRRSLSARVTKVGAWFFALPLVLSWIILPIVRGGWIGVAVSLLLIAAVLGVGHLMERPKRCAAQRLVHARTNQYRICPCGYDLAGSSIEGLCPECGKQYNPQSLKEHWEGGTYEQVIAKTWPPIGERRMWRALKWWQLATILAVPGSFFLIPSTLPRGGTILAIAFLAAAVSLLLYILRGHVFEWRALARQRFRRCPCCLRSLRTAPDTGACPNCRIEYTPDWLERTWALIYRKPGA